MLTALKPQAVNARSGQLHEYPRTRVQLVEIEGDTFARMELQPGWRWSTDIKPQVGTQSCEASHKGYVLSGRLGVRMDDGTEIELKPGDFAIIPPGHDAWVIGDEPYVAVDFGGIASYLQHKQQPPQEEDFPEEVEDFGLGAD
jgi:mannose-6-phosphate isomerase-like protein (cupin superfamily)